MRSFFFRTLAISFGTVFGILFSALVCSAHPHAFVSVQYTLFFDGEGFSGVEVSWTFDEMYSSMTADDFDKDKNGTLDTKESAELAKLALESLPDYGFFTHIDIDGTAFPVKKVKRMQVHYKKGILNYDFFVPCPVAGTKKPHRMKIFPYDETFFVAMFFQDTNPVVIKNGDAYSIKTTIGDDEDKLIYFDSVHPTALKLSFQKK